MGGGTWERGGLTAEIVSVEDGDGGHLDDAGDAGARQRALVLRRRWRDGHDGHVQDTHAHGDSHANLFPVIHVEPEQESPGQQGEGKIAEGRAGWITTR